MDTSPFVAIVKGDAHGASRGPRNISCDAASQKVIGKHSDAIHPQPDRGMAALALGNVPSAVSLPEDKVSAASLTLLCRRCRRGAEASGRRSPRGAIWAVIRLPRELTFSPYYARIRA